MYLCIDMGNTDTVFALIEEDRIIRHWRLATAMARSSDDYALSVGGLMRLENIAFEHVTDCVISCVVPQNFLNLVRFVKTYLGCEPLVVSAADCDFASDLAHPEELGADRIANALGVLEHYTPPLMVIDSGTATTIDVIDAKGRFIGGVIAPGIALSLQALHKGAARLPLVSVERTQRIVGKTTVEAMQSGVYWGYVGLIDYLIDRIREEQGPMDVIATGGVVDMYRNDMKNVAHFDMDLAVKGMMAFYKRKRHA